MALNTGKTKSTKSLADLLDHRDMHYFRTGRLVQ